MRKLLVATTLALTVLTGCGSSGTTSSDPAPRSGGSPGKSPDGASTEAVLDTITYDGTLQTLPKGPGSTQKQQVGIYCADPAGQDCNVTGLSAGNQDVLDLVRTDADSFTVDLKGTKSTCETAGANEVTGTIELSGRSMSMKLNTAGARVKCSDGELVYEPGTLLFHGEYVEGGLPGFTVDGATPSAVSSASSDPGS